MWINEYLHIKYGENHALEIIHDIDRQYVNKAILLHIYLSSTFRISVVPSYAGLRRFSEGRDFEQWTGDDSKALMKVI
jgi:hypothetical protein